MRNIRHHKGLSFINDLTHWGPLKRIWSATFGCSTCSDLDYISTYNFLMCWRIYCPICIDLSNVYWLYGQCTWSFIYIRAF